VPDVVYHRGSHVLGRIGFLSLKNSVSVSHGSKALNE
jgi:hypothetical protein